MTISFNGTSGVTFPDASTQATAATGFGFKNRIINGAMMIDQRNAGASVTNPSGYTLDRWQASASGGSINVQQVAGTGAYAYDTLLTGGSGVTHAYFYQRIENLNCLDLTSKSVTFQVQLSSTTATSVTVSLYAPSTANSFPGSLVSSTTISITSTPTIYSWTVNAGANAANGLQVQIDFGALTSGTARVSGVQLEKGSTATSFDYRPYGTELALCQRYFELFGTGDSGAWANSTTASIGSAFAVTKRASPTLAIVATPDILQVAVAARVGSGSVIGSAYISVSGARYDVSGFSGATAQNGAIVENTTPPFSASAEL